LVIAAELAEAATGLGPTAGRGGDSRRGKNGAWGIGRCCERTRGGLTRHVPRVAGERGERCARLPGGPGCCRCGARRWFLGEFAVTQASAQPAALTLGGTWERVLARGAGRDAERGGRVGGVECRKEMETMRNPAKSGNCPGRCPPGPWLGSGRVGLIRRGRHEERPEPGQIHRARAGSAFMTGIDAYAPEFGTELGANGKRLKRAGDVGLKESNGKEGMGPDDAGDRDAGGPGGTQRR